jgi:hypothetical protein
MGDLMLVTPYWRIERRVRCAAGERKCREPLTSSLSLCLTVFSELGVSGRSDGLQGQRWSCCTLRFVNQTTRS